MDMTGQHRIPTSIDRVWEALNDPDILRQSIQGCEELTRLSDTELMGKVVAKVGPVKARFSGKVTISDIDAPNGYTISGEGTGGIAGFAKGGATVKLVQEGGDTVLSYEVKANVGGKLAQIGSRLVDSTARKMADAFFTNFVALVAPAGMESPEVPAAAGDPAI